MNEAALAQYRATKRHRAKVAQGKAIPRLRHLSHEFPRREGFFKPISGPAPALSKGFTDAYLHILGLVAAIPFLRRREKQWRK